MKTILVPTDFSKNARIALDYAISLAKKEKAKIILLHTFNMVYISPDTPIQYFDEMLISIGSEAKKKLDKLCDLVKKTSKITCESINLQGLIIDNIVEIIKRKKVDLVVMGTKGASGINEILIGSNTAKVIGKAPCPVIAVPGKASFKGIKKIVFATDYHSQDPKVLKQLTELAKLFKSKISVLHIADGEFSVEKEAEYLKKFEKKVRQKNTYKNISFKLLFSDEVEKIIELFLKKESADLLAVSTKDKILADRILGEKTTKKLAYHTKVPMIVYHSR